MAEADTGQRVGLRRYFSLPGHTAGFGGGQSWLGGWNVGLLRPRGRNYAGAVYDRLLGVGSGLVASLPAGEDVGWEWRMHRWGQRVGQQQGWWLQMSGRVDWPEVTQGGAVDVHEFLSGRVAGSRLFAETVVAVERDGPRGCGGMAINSIVGDQRAKGLNGGVVSVASTWAARHIGPLLVGWEAHAVMTPQRGTEELTIDRVVHCVGVAARQRGWIRASSERTWVGAVEGNEWLVYVAGANDWSRTAKGPQLIGAAIRHPKQVAGLREWHVQYAPSTGWAGLSVAYRHVRGTEWCDVTATAAWCPRAEGVVVAIGVEAYVA